MKILSILLMTMSLCVSSTFAGGLLTIDDLQSLKIRVNAKILHADVHYPNYRMGGGTPPTRLILDCLVLDILDSDNNLTLATKQDISEKIQVLQGFGVDINEKVELTPTVKNDKIVFKLLKDNFYVTTLSVTTRDGRSFTEVLDNIMPPTRQGNNRAPVNLLYVRDCRL